MKKVLAVIGVLFLCSFAGAQTFGFLSSGGNAEYCNYEQLVLNGTGVYSGIDNISACGEYYYAYDNGSIVGFAGSLSAADGLPTSGKGVEYGDSLYEALYYDCCLYFLNDQWTVHTALKANKINKYGHPTGAWSWIGVAGSSYGFYFGDNYGYLTTTIPNAHDKSFAKNGTTLGKAMGATKSQPIKLNK